MYIKLGYDGVHITRTCFSDVSSGCVGVFIFVSLVLTPETHFNIGAVSSQFEKSVE